jgi:hypothetical protein
MEVDPAVEEGQIGAAEPGGGKEVPRTRAEDGRFCVYFPLYYALSTLYY